MCFIHVSVLPVWVSICLALLVLRVQQQFSIHVSFRKDTQGGGLIEFLKGTPLFLVLLK